MKGGEKVNAMRLNIADLMFSNQASIKSRTQQGSRFGDLLLQQSGSLPARGDIKTPLQQNQKQQLADVFEQVGESLPDEVLAILKDNDVLQEEIVALLMENAVTQQESSLEKNGDQQRLQIENLLSQYLSSALAEHPEISSMADLQPAIDIYNEITKQLQGIEQTADIHDTSSLLAQLLQDWEQFFKENPEIDKQEVLDGIYQQMQHADSSIFEQTVHQMAYQMLEAGLREEEINDADDFENVEVIKALQDFNEFMLRADGATAEQIEKKIDDLLIEAGLMTEEQMKGSWVEAEQAEQQARIQQFIQGISQQLQIADSSVSSQIVNQIAHQLLAANLPEEQMLNNRKANSAVVEQTDKTGLDVEGLQRVEARIAGWLQSIFKEVSPGVIKQNNDVQLVRQTANETGYHQPVKAEAEVVPRIEPKMAAWLQTSFQDASPAVFKQDSLPISKIEQFIVQMGQTDSSKGLSGKELIEKIETIVQSQRLQNFVRGQNPISIQLRPENLGDMTIRFIQTNGELTVQMLVSSKAVKEVLESNLHQLRNVFSPHQVSVERQDNVNASQTDASKNAKENQSEQHSEHQETASDSNEQDSSSETESFESFMEKLLSQNIEEQV